MCQVLVVEFEVEFGAGIDDSAINTRAYGYAAGPVIGGQRQLESGGVHIGHGNKPALSERGAPSAAIFKIDAAQKHAAPEIEFLTIRENVHPSQVEPFAAVNAELEREPVRKVNQILVFDDASGDIGALPVVTAREIGSRIIDIIHHGPGGRSPGGKISVAERAQGFA